jgi:phosphatidylserine synthase
MHFLSPAIKRIVAVLFVAAGGFWLHRYGLGHHIPAFYVKYGYAALWAAMIYFLVALLLRSRPQKQILVIAALVCVLLEASKLSHTPTLEIFRMTAAGGWLPGRVFSPWNFCALAAGLAVAWAIDSLLSHFGSTSKSRSRRR